MTWKQRAARLINGVLRPLDVQIVRGPTDADVHESLRMDKTLKRIARRNIEIGSIIDVGASDGCWYELTFPCFPQARGLLVDANPVHRPALESFVRKHPKAEFIIAAAGSHSGEIDFHIDENNPRAGQASNTPLGPGALKVPVIALDDEIRKRGLPGPYLLKLDTHGYECDVFDGAREILQNTNLIVVEVYNFCVAGGALRFHEMCAYLEERGFRLFDLADPARRPRDLALWQMDFFFLRSDRPEFQSDGYY